MSIELSQHQGLPSDQALNELEYLIVVLPENLKPGDWQRLPHSALLAKLLRRGSVDGEPATLVATNLPNDISTRVVVATADVDTSQFQLLSAARRIADSYAKVGVETAGLVVAGFQKVAAERVGEALLAALLAGNASLPDYKRKPRKQATLKRIELYGVNPRHRFRRSFAEAEGAGLARHLAILPPNELTPTTYRKRVTALAREHGWQMKFFGVDELTKHGAGAFLAVAQASPVADAGMIRLRYKPKGSGQRSSGRAKNKKLALVGKGICYDTGGVNLKPARYMLGMHEDMTGSAIALGTLLTLSLLEVRFEVECWLALATNHIGPKSYQPNDVITALDGTTIEIIHSDAEGRMVLADTLTMASRGEPKVIIDYATLTGTCMQALGKSYSGVFTNRREFESMLIDAGRDSGERVWPFPLDEDYDKGLESQIADVKQCSIDGEADHILAARFLQRFVKQDVPWIHVDLASSNRKGGLAHVPTDTTGFGVRFTTNLVLDKKLM